MRESATLEFKATVSRTFLKTVSAYANYGTGSILFGIADNGSIIGIENTDQARLSIENAINDALDPRPTYFMAEKCLEGKRVVELTVHEGPDKPYLCSGKAYQRFDTSTVAVDRSELRRLSIEGSPVPFDEMRSRRQELGFTVLCKYLKESMGIGMVTEDTLKTLGLLRDGVLNNAAALLSDENDFPGLDIVRYDQDELSIHERITCEGVSVLAQLDTAVAEFQRHYVVEQVQGMRRARVETVPEESFREAVANALAHRIWYNSGRTIASFYPDRIEIASPGGLPRDIDEALYLSGGVSVPRNSTLAYVFLRLGIIEQLGTGVKRIQRSYENSLVKPVFHVSDYALKVMLPRLSLAHDLTDAERAMLALFVPGLELSGAELEKATGLSRATALRIATSLREKGALLRTGKARATRYRLP